MNTTRNYNKLREYYNKLRETTRNYENTTINYEKLRETTSNYIRQPPLQRFTVPQYWPSPQVTTFTCFTESGE